MEILIIKKKFFPLLPTIFLTLLFTACNNDDDTVAELSLTTLENVEIGLDNNGIGTISRDFHFNAEVVAGDKIDNVQVKIIPNEGETYSHEWSFEIIWDEYKGAKNATIHKHFDIPKDAAEGKYDFVIIVNEENGAKLEKVLTISLYLPENLPVDPQLGLVNIFKSGNPFYSDGEFAEGNQLAQNDTLSSQVSINGVKGDGTLYILLIKKALDHRPETIDEVDFSKAIVYDVFEHKDEELVFPFSNFVFDIETFTAVRTIPDLIIGAGNDNNAPQSNPIEGEKAWDSGAYHYGILYKNTTYNTNFHHYLEFEINF